MSNFYFTFGSDESYPYPNRFVLVQAFSYHKALCAFRERHPDRTQNVLHCAFVYTQEEWDQVDDCMKAGGPAEIIIAAA